VPAVAEIVRRLAVAVELERARDGVRVATFAGVVTRTDVRRVRDAEAAWDAACGRAIPRQRGRS